MGAFSQAGRLRSFVRKSRRALSALARALEEPVEPAPPAVRGTADAAQDAVVSDSAGSASAVPGQEAEAPLAAPRFVACSEPSAEPVRSMSSGLGEPAALHGARLGLIEQRLDVISERLELLQERVRQSTPAARPAFAPQPAIRVNPERSARTETQRVARAASERAAQLAIERLSERVNALEQGNGSSFSKLSQEGTLRPPQVPRGLEVPGVDAREVVSGSERPENSRQRASSGPVLSGTLNGLSLGSLFSLLEFERSGGVLCLRNEAHNLELSLREGQVVRCDLDGNRTPAALAVREAFTWPSSNFSFHREATGADSEPPQSVNALMLDALRFHDEELRLG